MHTQTHILALALAHALARTRENRHDDHTRATEAWLRLKWPGFALAVFAKVCWIGRPLPLIEQNAHEDRRRTGVIERA